MSNGDIIAMVTIDFVLVMFLLMAMESYIIKVIKEAKNEIIEQLKKKD